MRETVDAVAASAAALTSQFSRINRILLLLIRWRSRIQYQYEIADSTIYFRVRSNNENLHRSRDDIMQLFSFTVVGYNGFRAVNCCTIERAGAIMQFEIRTPKRRMVDEEDLLADLWEHSKSLLSKLPFQSPAATEPINRIGPHHER